MQVLPFPDVSGLRSTGAAVHRPASAVLSAELPLPSSAHAIAGAREPEGTEVLQTKLAVLLHHYLAHEKSGVSFLVPSASSHPEQEKTAWKRVHLDFAAAFPSPSSASESAAAGPSGEQLRELVRRSIAEAEPYSDEEEQEKTAGESEGESKAKLVATAAFLVGSSANADNEEKVRQWIKSGKVSVRLRSNSVYRVHQGSSGRSRPFPWTEPTYRSPSRCSSTRASCACTPPPLCTRPSHRS